VCGKWLEPDAGLQVSVRVPAVSRLIPDRGQLSARRRQGWGFPLLIIPHSNKDAYLDRLRSA